MRWFGVLVLLLGLSANASVQPPAEPAPAQDECACDPPVPGEVQRLRTEVRLLKAAARVNEIVHAKIVKRIEAFKSCVELVDPAKWPDCKALLR